MFLFYLGLVIIVIASIGFLIAAFQESILWGLGCLLFSPISIVFLIMYWNEAKNPFFLQLIGLAIMFTGLHFMGPQPTTLP